MHRHQSGKGDAFQTDVDVLCNNPSSASPSSPSSIGHTARRTYLLHNRRPSHYHISINSHFTLLHCMRYCRQNCGWMDWYVVRIEYQNSKIKRIYIYIIVKKGETHLSSIMYIEVLRRENGTMLYTYHS